MPLRVDAKLWATLTRSSLFRRALDANVMEPIIKTFITDTVTCSKPAVAAAIPQEMEDMLNGIADAAKTVGQTDIAEQAAALPDKFKLLGSALATTPLALAVCIVALAVLGGTMCLGKGGRGVRVVSRGIRCGLTFQMLLIDMIVAFGFTLLAFGIQLGLVIVSSWV